MFRVPARFLEGGWDAFLVKVLIATVHVQNLRGQWNLFSICCGIERVGAFEGLAAGQIRKKWRELALNGFLPAVRQDTAYKRRMKERASDLTLVESGIHMCRALPDFLTLKSAIRALSQLVEREETEEFQKARKQRKRGVP